MHPRELARGNAEADQRITAAAAALAEQDGLSPDLVAALSAYERDPATREMRRRLAVADLLEALVGAGEKQKAATAGDLQALSVPDLKDLAQQRGVELEARLKKADIIAALEAEKPAPSPEPEQQP
jgi:hypothetical protein